MTTDPMHRTDEDVDAFLTSEGISAGLAQLDALITGVLPDASRTLWRGVMWGGTQQAIIGYGDIKQGKVEWFLLGIAQQKDHLSLYVNAADGGKYLSKVYGTRLGKVKIGSAAVTFKRFEDLDEAVVRELVEHAGRVGLA